MYGIQLGKKRGVGLLEPPAGYDGVTESCPGKVMIVRSGGFNDMNNS
jgi:hypothetical protein